MTYYLFCNFRIHLLANFYSPHPLTVGLGFFFAVLLFVYAIDVHVRFEERIIFTLWDITTNLGGRSRLGPGIRDLSGWSLDLRKFVLT